MREGEPLESCAVHRASPKEIDHAFAMVKEYYDEVGVVVREDRAKFEEQYFEDGTGVWLAEVSGEEAGCVALRKLGTLSKSGEIKRMYVRSAHRGKGVAGALLGRLEKYAVKCGYEWLYLDTTDSMKAAARFYERSGYERCERYNENPQATVFMRKKVARRQ
jgi:GNAT superfamily N-acetyltransferase